LELEGDKGIVISKFLERHSQGKHTMAPAYSRALLRQGLEGGGWTLKRRDFSLELEVQSRVRGDVSEGSRNLQQSSGGRALQSNSI